MNITDNFNSEDVVCCPISLKIYQDWEPALKMSESLIDKSATHHSDIRRVANTDFHDLGPLGSVGYHYISERWNIVSGIWMHKYFPWLKQMREDFKELTPDFTLTIARSDITEHIDADTWPCAINYPLFTADAETYLKCNGNEYTYPSNADEPWLLTTQLVHGVRNPSKYRACFSIHFAEPYSVVKSWFDAHPNLVYGK